jgi:hypothetical protein
MSEQPNGENIGNIIEMREKSSIFRESSFHTLLQGKDIKNAIKTLFDLCNQNEWASVIVNTNLV